MWSQSHAKDFLQLYLSLTEKEHPTSLAYESFHSHQKRSVKNTEVSGESLYQVHVRTAWQVSTASKQPDALE